MNLNISTQITNNSPKNLSGNEGNSNKTQFDGFFEGLKNSIEDTEVGMSANTKDSEDTIDYDLLLNILNNLKIFSQLGDSEKLNNEIIGGLNKVDLDSITKFMESNEDIQRIIKELIADKDLNSIELSKENIQLLNNIKEVLKNKNTENFDIKEIDELLKSTELKEANSEMDGSQIINNDNLENGSDLNIDQEYKELEIISLNNKSNLLQGNNFETSDKELSTLESIVEGNDNFNFVFSNQTRNNAINEPSNEMTENTPIKEIRQEFIGDDVVKTVRYLKSNGLEEIKIKISPRELGDMTIKLIKNAEETKVSIIISKEDVFDLVNKNIGEITKHLNDLNINVKDVSVDIKTDNKKMFSENLNQQFNNKNQQEQQRKSKYKNTKFASSDANIDENTEVKAEDDLNILI